jgi:peptide/nickel transport system substrate-binding protein
LPDNKKLEYIMPKNWKKIGRILTFRDKFIVVLLTIIAGVSLVVWINVLYSHFTKAIPKTGGEYIEGIVGQPLYINPLLSQTSEADGDLSQLIYSGLFKYNKDGDVVPDLAESYSISDDQKEYTISLRKDVLWHDEKQLTAQDVFFTYNILLDSAYKSPLRQNFQGVSMSLADDYVIVFSLKNAYAGFLDNLTVGVLPKHIWENIAPEKFSLAEYNLHPVGSGPYMFSDFQKDSSGNILTLSLASWKKYYNGTPYISNVTFNFYPDDSKLIEAYNKKEIMGMGSIPPQNVKDIKNIKSTNINELAIPRYFAVFLNQTKNVALANDEVRKALNLGVNRQEIIDNILYGKGLALSSPFFPQMDGYKDQSVQYNIDEANKILDNTGWILDKDANIRKKGSNNLEFELITPDWPELAQTADLLKQQWEKIGAKVNVKILTVSDLQQNYIKTREYDSLLFGQAISFNPDLYSFWHSSQKHDPGLNLSMLDNKDADTLLENVRQETDQGKRIEDYHKFQDILAQEIPAIFLYGRYYLYPTNTSVQGIDAISINNPQQRFIDVNKWYVKTKRVFK